MTFVTQNINETAEYLYSLGGKHCGDSDHRAACFHNDEEEDASPDSWLLNKGVSGLPELSSQSRFDKVTTHDKYLDSNHTTCDGDRIVNA
jgi:hypothetical protein